jgi:two-component system NtrC family sensor kinase
MARPLPLRARIALVLALTLVAGFGLNVFAAILILKRVEAIEQRVEPAGRDVTRALAGTAELKQDHLPGFRWASSALIGYLALNAGLTLLVGVSLLGRAVARPIDHIEAAADRIGRLELDDPFEGRPSALGPLGFAFERMAANLKAERARVQTQIAELERLNKKLSEARDSLVRSEKLATVGRLAAGVAHEVGNPLGAILGYLELAKSKAPAAGEYLESIDREVARIDRTVRELLDFSRPSANAAELRPVNLKDSVSAAVRLASVQKRLKNADFSLEIDPAVSIWAEPHHLSQVLVNVLLNAGDAMREGGCIEIRSAPGRNVPAGRRATDPPAGPRIELSISDTGSGIAEENLPRIFDPFFTTKEPGAGAGLGLAICHRILETFGGDIRAANRPGGGAVMTLTLRVAQENKA